MYARAAGSGRATIQALVRVSHVSTVSENLSPARQTLMIWLMGGV